MQILNHFLYKRRSAKEDLFGTLEEFDKSSDKITELAGIGDF